MKRLVAFISNPRVQIRWWGFWTLTWLVLDPVTMLTPLSRSIPWLEEMSLFANFASCGTALVAAWSYFRARRVDESIDTAAHFAAIEAAVQQVRDTEARIITQVSRVLDALVDEPTP